MFPGTSRGLFLLRVNCCQLSSYDLRLDQHHTWTYHLWHLFAKLTAGGLFVNDINKNTTQARSGSWRFIRRRSGKIENGNSSMNYKSNLLFCLMYFSCLLDLTFKPQSATIIAEPVQTLHLVTEIENLEFMKTLWILSVLCGAPVLSHSPFQCYSFPQGPTSAYQHWWGRGSWAPEQ